MNFGALAADALARPTRNVGFHIWPYELGCDRLNGPLDSWVAQAMNDFENSSSPSLRHEGARWAITDVDDDVAVSDVNFLEV